MVNAGRFLAYFLFFVLALMYLMPKAGIYYLLEEQIKPYDVVISKESVNDSGLGLEITDAVVFIKSIESAQIGSVNVKLFALFNALDVKNLTLSSVASAVIPLHVQEVRIRHSVLNPLEVIVDGEADAGEFHATFHLLERVLHMRLKPSAEMLKDYKSTLSNLKPSENGEYVYEKTI